MEDVAPEDLRRLRVASLHVRGLTPLEIMAALEQNGLRDPATRQPYGLACVCADIAFIEALWREEVAAGTREHRARVWAELQEAKRAAWAAGDVARVLGALKQEAALFRLEDVLDV